MEVKIGPGSWHIAPNIHQSRQRRSPIPQCTAQRQVLFHQVDTGVRDPIFVLAIDLIGLVAQIRRGRRESTWDYLTGPLSPCVA